MKFVTGLFAIFILATQTSYAGHGCFRSRHHQTGFKEDVTVSCVEAKKKNGPVVVSYQIQGTKSARLGSDVTINNQVISSFQVAQYKATGNELFLLLDDALTNTTPIYAFQARGRITKGLFSGSLTEYNAAGKPVSSKHLKCKLTPVQ